MKASLFLLTALFSLNAVADDGVGFQKLADCKVITNGLILLTGDAKFIKETTLRPIGATLSQDNQDGKLVLKAEFKGLDGNREPLWMDLVGNLMSSIDGSYYRFDAETTQFPTVRFVKMELEYLPGIMDKPKADSHDKATTEAAPGTTTAPKDKGLFSVMAAYNVLDPKTNKPVEQIGTTRYLCDMVPAIAY